MRQSDIQQKPAGDRLHLPRRRAAHVERPPGERPPDQRQAPAVRHFRRPVEHPFLPHERRSTTILTGISVSLRHEQMVTAALHGLGYRAEMIPAPTQADYRTGKEFGNVGYCNPSHFIVGALINHLQRLRDEEGMSTEQIIADYAFVTAGSCGPCRFGMYEAEYRLALRNAGFDGFRVLLFKVSEGLSQSSGRVGLELNTVFFLALVNALMIGDLLNEIAYQVMPYAVDTARAREVMDRCVEICAEALRTKDTEAMRRGLWARLLGRVAPPDGPADGVALLDQLSSAHYTGALDRCRRLIDEEIEVDNLRPKPIVKIMGEFWDQHTDCEGNYRMPLYLEEEGAEALVEPIATWLDYLLNEARMRLFDRRGLPAGADVPKYVQASERSRIVGRSLLGVAMLTGGEQILRRSYERLRRALGGTAHRLASQPQLVRIAHPFYNSRSVGGEGHLEVAKSIYYHTHSLAHMVLSLKPFGCMPSTQSDGVHAAVLGRYPELNFLPLETSGDSDVSALSRVQMALGEAKATAKAEFRQCLEDSGYGLEQIRDYASRHAELRRPLTRIPEYEDVAGRAARFVRDVGALMDRDPALARVPSVGEPEVARGAAS